MMSATLPPQYSPHRLIVNYENNLYGSFLRWSNLIVVFYIKQLHHNVSFIKRRYISNNYNYHYYYCFNYFFLGNVFWYIVMQSPCFCKWTWILNWSKSILLVDILTQNSLTILGFIDHSSRCRLDVYVIAHTEEELCSTNMDTFFKICKAVKVKRVNKIWLRMSITNINLLPFKI